MNHRPLDLILVLTFALLVNACTRSPVLAPVGKDPRVQDLSAKHPRGAVEHVVTRGDTLYGIAFQYALDYRALSNWNLIARPYVIYPGQRIRLTAPDASEVAVQQKQPKLQTDDTQAVPSSDETATGVVAKIPELSSEQILLSAPVSEWAWPANGKLVTSFKKSGKKGIDISGELGHPVRAAAKGKVVYSGGGLIGYGELIIIKHNNHYLSAYGHNDKLLVKQGDYVTRGQQIAMMGHSGTDKVKLHFEIRRDGKPVDPTRYLPK